MLFVPYGGGAVWGTTNLTYSFSNFLDGSWSSGITTSQMQQAAEEAMGTWSSVTPLTFTQVGDSGPAPSDNNYDAAGHPLIRWGHHLIDGGPVGGQVNALGHGFRPGTNGLNGDIHFDNGDTFTANAFLQLAAHEIGHTLGLDHPNGEATSTTCPPRFAAIMHACIGGNGAWNYTGLGTAFLLQDDIDGIRSLYDAGLGYVLNSTGQLSVFGTPQTDIFSVGYDFGSNTLTVRNGGNEFSRTLSGITQVAINSGGGDDLIFVGALPSHVITVVNGGAGSDSLTLRGSDGGDTLQLLNGSTAYNNGSGILFNDISRVTLSGHGGPDVLDVMRTPAGLPVTVNGGDLDDQIYVGNFGSGDEIQSAMEIFGDNGNDTVYLAPNAPGAISVISAPVGFNGGAGADTLYVGSGGLHAVSGLVTFSAGALGEGNTIHLDDSANALFVDYYIGETSITRDTPFFFGGVNYSGVGSITLHASGGPNVVTINATSISSALVNGNGGDDNFIIGNGNNLAGGVGLFTGNGGEGIDTLTLNDSLSTHDLPWAILGNGTFDPQTVYLGLQAYDLEGYEGVTVLAGNGHNNVQLTGTMAQHVTLNTGGGNDTVELNAISNFRDFFTQDDDPPFNYAVDIDGGTGFNSLRVDDVNTFNRWYVIGAESIIGYDEAPLGMRFSYDSFQSVTIQGGNDPQQYGNTFTIFGTSGDIPAGQQMTLIGGTGDHQFELFPRDAEGNLTINGNLGVLGGVGTDSLHINDSGSSLPIEYRFYNQFGPGTTNIAGLGAALFGALNNIETITVSAGTGNDTVHIDAFQSGSALVINGGAGDDTVNFGLTTVAGITNMASFRFDGQADVDTFNFNNRANPDAWTYNRSVGVVGASSSAGANYGLNETNVERVQLIGGPQPDSYYVHSVSPGTETAIYAGGGRDGLAIGAFTSSAEEIQGRVSFFGEGEGGHVAVYDGNDVSDDVVHVTASEVGAATTDTLFGPGGSLSFSDLADDTDGIGLRLFLGSGSDTVAVTPYPFASIAVHGADPNSAPGDRLQIVLAGVTDPVLTPTGIGAGTFTFTSAQPIYFTGFESAETAVPGDLNADGAVDAADAAEMFANWSGAGTGDLDGDGIVDAADAGILFAHWTGDSVQDAPINTPNPLASSNVSNRRYDKLHAKLVDTALAQLESAFRF